MRPPSNVFGRTTVSGSDAWQNFPNPPNTYAKSWRDVSTGSVFRLPGSTDRSRRFHFL